MQSYSNTTARYAKGARSGCFTQSTKGPVVRWKGQQHRQAAAGALSSGSLLWAKQSSSLRLRDVAANAQLLGCKLAGVGSSVPSTVLSNVDLEQFVDTNDEWITTRTGIKRRHILAEGESMSEHAAKACAKALEMAGVSAEDVNIVLMSTSTPDDVFGSACQVQAAIGAKNAVAFDLTAACSGFVLGLVTAAQYIRTGMAKHILVVGADAMSRVVDWRDRGTCILFGDGCGAVLVSAAPDGESCSLLGVDMHSDGNGMKSLHASYSGCGGKPFQVSSLGRLGFKTCC
eukprot:GHUV01033202.1.p1 GENE.GHUV01033202.1~~GHUV01033202.1.p1  ORF type:complete len:287 (+),score=53.14 GHUV01033202.1:171-1031(+)